MHRAGLPRWLAARGRRARSPHGPAAGSPRRPARSCRCPASGSPARSPRGPRTTELTRSPRGASGGGALRRVRARVVRFFQGRGRRKGDPMLQPLRSRSASPLPESELPPLSPLCCGPSPTRRGSPRRAAPARRWAAPHPGHVSWAALLQFGSAPPPGPYSPLLACRRRPAVGTTPPHSPPLESSPRAGYRRSSPASRWQGSPRAGRQPHSRGRSCPSGGPPWVALRSSLLQSPPRERFASPPLGPPLAPLAPRHARGPSSSPGATIEGSSAPSSGQGRHRRLPSFPLPCPPGLPMFERAEAAARGALWDHERHQWRCLLADADSGACYLQLRTVQAAALREVGHAEEDARRAVGISAAQVMLILRADVEWERLRAEVVREEGTSWEMIIVAGSEVQILQEDGVARVERDAPVLAAHDSEVTLACRGGTTAESTPPPAVDEQSVEIDGCSIRFDAGDQVGKGAYGTIHRGTLDGSACAVKKIREDGQRADLYALCVQALAEARSFDHPNVVRTLALGRAPGVMWHVMPLADCDLDAVCGKVPLVQACRCAAKIAAGIAYLHQRELVHRDIKTSNVLMFGDEPRICDFDSTVRRGFVGGEVMVCTWAYTSPEVVRNSRDGKPEDTPRDVYALGLLAHCLIQGALPPPLVGSIVDVVKGLPKGAQKLAAQVAGRPDVPEAQIAQEGFFSMLASGCIIPDVGAVQRDARKPLNRCLSRDPSNRDSARKIAERFSTAAAKIGGGE
eukprot:TRINITY_DN13835_c1_g2_i1.p1 TRINITY_DN13835_c1_g2~~TRINITY_DN13835_c1_g2_i1.p1  ORF type:complete len:741 (+),score=67.42 TRINITY_DN13835_c1_g2_i1:85-2307(+)